MACNQHLELRKHKYLKSIRTAWGKVWKLLLRLICVPSTMAILPNTWWQTEKCRPQNQSQLALNDPEVYLVKFFCNFEKLITFYLHSYYSIYEEQHGDQECNIGKSLGEKKERVRLWIEWCTLSNHNNSTRSTDNNIQCQTFLYGSKGRGGRGRGVPPSPARLSVT